MDVDKRLLSEQKEISWWINFKTICKQHKWMILITISIIVIAALVSCIIAVCSKDNNTQQNNTEDKQNNEQNS